MDTITFTAVTPDGHGHATRSSKTQTYTHARWIKFPDEDHQVIISWHRSETAAHKSPFQTPVWKNFPWGVVPVAAEGVKG